MHRDAYIYTQFEYKENKLLHGLNLFKEKQLLLFQEVRCQEEFL